ncbi:iron-containing redox enzyme family protein [Microbacterium terrisoli]|uniref:iron-containing redox enzyme family protein n=1 Tax=Microbacterium terrisoli TaxID=3242192 RepID=UPI00280539C7|nr:iron-containing redox enzyme family protein [Microbacterium protaetiae]
MDTTRSGPVDFRLLRPRGPLSSAILQNLSGRNDVDLVAAAKRSIADTDEILVEGDIQLALFVLYALAYGSLSGLDPRREWDADLLAVRSTLERPFETAIRSIVPHHPLPEPSVRGVATTLFALTAGDGGPSLTRFLAKKATREQALEFLILRSIYTLREADPHSWAIPRLTGRAKAALVEIQADEYGGGRADRIHAEIFAKSMRGAGLNDGYGAYADVVPAVTLTALNMMSMFGLNRRLVGAIVGHLAAFEMTSSIPNRLYGDGLRRLGFGEDVTDYFDEHVEADAVHEQIAGRDLAGTLAEDHPELLPDIIFGAAACLAVDGLIAEHVLDCWQDDRSALLTTLTGARR